MILLIIWISTTTGQWIEPQHRWSIQTWSSSFIRWCWPNHGHDSRRWWWPTKEWSGQYDGSRHNVRWVDHCCCPDASAPARCVACYMHIRQASKAQFCTELWSNHWFGACLLDSYHDSTRLIHQIQKRIRRSAANDVFGFPAIYLYFRTIGMLCHGEKQCKLDEDTLVRSRCHQCLHDCYKRYFEHCHIHVG